jgi:hypothetical protein
MDFLHVVLGSIDNCSRDSIKLIKERDVSDNVEQFLFNPIALLISHFFIF